MRQAVLEKAGRFRLTEAPRPAPGEGQVLLRVKAVGICGSDLHLFREGKIGDVPIERAEGRFIPGHECMGVVEECGPGVDRKLVGARAAVDPMAPCGRCEICLKGDQNLCPQVIFLGHPPVAGCLQEYVVLRADQVTPLPAELGDDAGVILEPLGVALHTIRVGKIKPGGTAAVLGCGPIGLCCTMLLARMGVSTVLATDLLDERLDLAREFGARETVNAAKADPVAAVRRLTGGRGVDYVLECAGAASALEQTAEVACVGGRVLVLGIPAADEDRVFFKHSSARRKGLSIFMVRRSNQTLRECIRWALADRLPLDRLVTHHWKLDQVQQAFDAVAGHVGGVVKGIVNP
jgi:L-iditol 2-dehydrogenase